MSAPNWGCSATRVFGGGSGDGVSLRSLAALIGEHGEITYGTSTGKDGHHSSSTDNRKVNTRDIAALGSLPEWRAIVFSSKCRPVMVNTVFWSLDTTLTTTINRATTRTPAPRRHRSRCPTTPLQRRWQHMAEHDDCDSTGH